MNASPSGGDDLLLAIDNGTQSVRALAFDLRGQLVAKSRVALTYERPQPGWMELEPDAFWRALCEACQSLWSQGIVTPQRLRGVVVTTQRATVINLDRDGQPLRPAIVWADQRRVDAPSRLAWWWRAAFRALGLHATIRSFEQEAECNWIAAHQHDVWSRTHRFVLLSGYFSRCLTGRDVDAVGNQVGYLPFDYKHHRWAGRGDWKWQCLAVTREQLPELVPSGTVIGVVTAQAAGDTGIPAGLPVVAGATDKACEVLGAGCTTPEVACLSYGTAATVNTTTARYVEPLPFIPPYPAAIAGLYNTEVMVSRGYWMVSWFAEQFGALERQRAAEAGSTPEAYFDELVNATAPGASGLLLQPYWNPGVRVPGPEARGAVIGFTDHHTRSHLYRAIIEGLAFALREGKERIERRAKTPITRLVVAGGGSQSDAAMQITADVFGLPAARPALYEASGLGAAIVASVGLKLHPDVATAVKAMTRSGRVFEPLPDAVRLYDSVYRRVYTRMYERLKPLYEELHALGEAMRNDAAETASPREAGRGLG